MSADVNRPVGWLDRKPNADLLSVLPFSATMQKRKRAEGVSCAPHPSSAAAAVQLCAPTKALNFTLARKKKKKKKLNINGRLDEAAQGYSLNSEPICWRGASPTCSAIG